ncbi:ABC transporter ATP-binding protein [Blastochloris viridis]|uniref:Branched-chain amino acid transport ATP-binding protein LivG n=1 Tax=Blastochloris viridis TaxID=1079 RepID=A0A0H5BDR9_BLAVI|nr:ABC transporter ATP-binding protein [Blastochloris viridis]ALK08258.1 Lipopolysaccharide export system ATP-binding protein LptB [Blastochloris viridis]BAR98476.1 branched-chain amino acid transport ATP-binding protein LivG [Blastochloris viridis]CUU44180.1 Lipopolysaccharide export system ATP-binding protein LptB [Blastochloris viridis]
MTILSVDSLSISFGGIRAVDAVSFAVNKAEIFSIIGPNGAGKTTLFNLISGIYRPDDGTIAIDGLDVTALRPAALARLGVSRTFQNLQLFGRMSVLDNVMTGRHRHERHGVLGHLVRSPATRAQEKRSREAAMACLARVGLDNVAGRVAGALPYGAMRRLEIARALAAEPRLLLLDEPAAGCNAAETEEIDRLTVSIAEGGITVVLIEHDMKLVMGISSRVLVLVEGRVLTVGTPLEVARDPRVVEAYLGAAAASPAEAAYA